MTPADDTITIYRHVLSQINSIILNVVNKGRKNIQFHIDRELALFGAISKQSIFFFFINSRLSLFELMDNQISWKIMVSIIFSARARKEQFVDQDQRVGERSELKNNQRWTRSRKGRATLEIEGSGELVRKLDGWERRHEERNPTTGGGDIRIARYF